MGLLPSPARPAHFSPSPLHSAWRGTSLALLLPLLLLQTAPASSYSSRQPPPLTVSNLPQLLLLRPLSRKRLQHRPQSTLLPASLQLQHPHLLRLVDLLGRASLRSRSPLRPTPLQRLLTAKPWPATLLLPLPSLRILAAAA